MKLSLRLQRIYDMTPQGVAADVGSDHGKLIISLFKNGIISKGYAIENKKGPYSRLCRAIKIENASDGVFPMFSDGISDLPSDTDTVIIAGMGGSTIIKIIMSHLDKLKNVSTLIVDAHNAIPELRKQISKIGFLIAEEDIVEEDGIYYEIIKFIRGQSAFLDDPDLEFGPLLRQEKSCTFKSKYEERIREIDNLLSKDNLPSSRIIELGKEKERIKSVLWKQE